MAEDFFGNLSKTLKKTVDTVGKKTDEFVEIQKIRTRQHALEDQIEKNYQDIGQIIYNRYLNGEAFDENLAGICKDITDLEKEIADCREDVANKRGRMRRKCSERCSFLHALRCCYAGEGRRAGGCRVCTRRTGRKSRRNRSGSAGRRAGRRA